MTMFSSIRIEGGLLGPDVLDQLLAGDLPGQRPADFGLDGRRNLTDEIAATFADARAIWGVFQHRLQRLPEADLATSVTRDAWAIPFLGLLGYEPRYNPRAYEVDGLTFAISHRAGLPSPVGSGTGGEGAEDTLPVHIVGARQELGRVPASGRPRLAPHSLVQEYLNRTEHLWGIVTNGLTLRLLRDSTFVRRQAYVEFDLPAILDEQRFQDFAALYRLVHRSRLPHGTADAGECLIEQYYQHSIEQGGRVREHLRDGVEQCITLLANGFLRHPANDELRRRASPACTGNERITAEGLYRQLLVLVYRFLFLLVSEDRGLLSPDPLYREHYGIARLRRLLEHRAAFTDQDDLWQSLRVLWLLLIKDEPQPAPGNRPMAAAIGLPVLNGELFTPLDLDGFTISNRDLLEAFWRLAWYQERSNSPPRRVNYAALDVEELGSVYEGLLEFHPHMRVVGSVPTFELLAEGRDRRSTGSHYTPPELVAPLIEHALEPVLDERLRAVSTRQEKERAILSMKVCDMACGSGHFLLAAARRLGKELARVRTGEDEPAPERVREAIRDCVSHCVYGVDKNPLAVELCRVALWLESHTEGKPLTFLDHRIRCGDSLVGIFDLAVLERGIPDEAFKPVAGDDKKAAREAKRLNAQERAQGLFHATFAEELRQIASQLAALDELPEDTIEQIHAKAETCNRIERSPDYGRVKFACDLWTAAFFRPFPTPSGVPLTTETLRTALANGSIPDARLAGFVRQAAFEGRFFHWPLAFPEVFAAGGFDVILGNPPFLGGLRISSEYGDKYRQWISSVFTPFSGTADLCAAFFRRAFTALNSEGGFGLIATNTISQGDTREGGLAVMRSHGANINFAKRFVKWPGVASVEVNLCAVRKRGWRGAFVLDGTPVRTISSRLDAEEEAEPSVLRQNADTSFIGSYVLGMGFTVPPDEAQRLIATTPQNADCLFPYLNGEDLNSDVQQQPSRWVINSFDWPLDRAEQYPELIDIVRRLAKPERDHVKRDRNRLKWWIYAENRHGLYRTIRPLGQVLVRARVSETHMMVLVPNGWVYSDRVVVFAFEDYYHFALLQSSVHEAWVWKNASSLVLCHS
ncbi:MAG: N-6 DNA methylase [Planctomycetia bacterium]|nr:N-6 DNA methylase [Planctomycetia bacterium]